MALKRTTRSTPATATTTTTTLVTNSQLKALIDQGVANVLAVHDADRSQNCEDSDDSGTGVRRQAPHAHCWSRCCLCNDLDKPKKKITDKYCLTDEIKKLEVELWNLKVKGTDMAGQNPTCFKCGAQGHFKRGCPKLKNNNRGNQGGNGNALAKVYAVSHAGTNPDSNIVTAFDTGADRSFVSTAFSSQIDVAPTTLDHYYDVELADMRIISLNTIIQGFTLNFLNHPFNNDLILIELGSFDVIIGTDWLAKYHVAIVCAEKIVLIP
nr:putative reverse transcriptase domain-containing protein [Tanacetum cinerariifolium]